jgi:uncharacterized membrane protein YqgA involved in biofilm formation
MIPFPKGSAINGLAIVIGTAIGFLGSQFITPGLQNLILPLMGLLTVCIGIKMFLRGDAILVIALSLVIGAAVGHVLDIQGATEHVAQWLKMETAAWFPAGGDFVAAAMTASLLFVIGPMAILGALEDGLENRQSILNLKSVMDGVTAILFTAALGPGVIVSAFATFIFQGTITVFSRQLAFLRDDTKMLDNISGLGGILLLGIGLNVAGLTSLPLANVLPALLLLPILITLEKHLSKRIHIN